MKVWNKNINFKHKKENEKFNICPGVNWEQAFVNDVIFWFVPFPAKRGRLDGDGLTWKTNENGILDSNKVDDTNIKRYHNLNILLFF